MSEAKIKRIFGMMGDSMMILSDEYLELMNDLKIQIKRLKKYLDREMGEAE